MTERLSFGRATALYTAALGAFLVVLSAADIWPLRVVYNASASVPLGWYSVTEPAALQAGDVVVVRPPIRVERLLVERGYLGDGVPLVKQIGGAVSIDGTPAALAREADIFGRPLPRWSGCLRLGQGDVFLLNSGAPGSFDGRYFGPSPARDIIGKAHPLWTW